MLRGNKMKLLGPNTRQKTSFNRRLLVVAVASCLSYNAFAAEQQDAEEAKKEEGQVVTIIGSNIKRIKDIGTLPVTSLSESDIENTGAQTGDELLRSIPQLGEVAFNNERVIGGVNDARGDVSSINLRGVGTGNTLTLLNGRRLVLHPGTQSENFVPVSTVNANTLPVSGLRSLQVLRDGAAAIYGSDAVAGVINYQLEDDYEGSRASLSYGTSDGTSLSQTTFNYLTGFGFNDGKSHLTASFSYFERNGMMASERPYSAIKDLRNYPGLDERFVGDTQLDNRTTSTPWGEFRSSSLKTFHIQPDSMSGCVVDLGNGICADKGSISGGSDGRKLRFDAASLRSMTSDAERKNFYGYLTHDLGDGKEFFAEAIYYDATVNRLREQSGNLTAQRFTIAANAAHNPFGENVQVRRYRAIDTGQRDIEVNDESYRLLAGVSGSFDQWDWESAALYSQAETNDLARNRIRASAFQAAINNTDPSKAYNPFNGADIANPTTMDSTVNSQAVIDQFMVDVSRDSKTSLTLVDYKLSNSDLWSVPAGGVGLALGTEFRHETFEDDRDDLLDGSNPFVDQVTGKVLSGSDVLGSSPTPDSRGTRDVYSAYAEFLIPLIDTNSQYMEMQLAARYENFSDVGDAMKPKIAIFWETSEWLSLRASYAEGFRAPNLPQVVAEGVARSNTFYDPLTDSRYGILDIRSGSDDLKPEDDENTSFGVVFQPTDDLTFTADWWKIEQNGLVGILPAQTHLLYDALLRTQGSSNPAVVRDGVDNEVVQINNRYMNLDVRNIQGVDVSVVYDWETSFGEWDISLTAAKLQKFEQEADAISAQVIAAQKAGTLPDDITVAGAGDLMRQNGRPEIRARAAINWRYNQWGAGIRGSYVSDFEETSTTTKIDDEVILLPIDSFSRINLYADYRFKGEHFLNNSKVRFGINNVEDNAPPIADESFGYFSSVHSNRGRYFYVTFSKKF